MNKVRFSKIKNNHNRLRTDIIEGFASIPPQVGTIFYITGAPLKPGALGRIVNTSIIESIDEIDDGWLLHTRSGSIYKVEEMEQETTK